MRRPLGYACLFFILLVRLFYICFPPVMPDYSALKGREVYVRGRVSAVQTYEFQEELQILYTLEDVYLQEESISTKDNSDKIYTHNKIRCYSSHKNLQVHIGSMVWMKGCFMPFDAAQNPGQFDAQFYFHVQDIGGSLEGSQLIWSDEKRDPWDSFIFSVKAFLLNRVDLYFAPEYRGVIKTILLGDKSDLDEDLKQLYKEGGILHILTISGMHISMLGMGCFHLVRKLKGSPQRAAVTGLLAVLFYGALIGSQAAAFRAVCMFAMQMAAILLGRTYDRMTGILVAAVLLILEQSLYVFYAGFLLSFGAVLGMAVIPPVLEECVKSRRKIIQGIVKHFSGSLSILLATLPIQMYYFYEYPLYSMLVNVAVLPFVPYIVGISVAVLAFPLSVGFMTVPFVGICQGILYGYQWICLESRKLPYHAVILGAPKPWQVVVYYGSLILWLCWIKNKEEWKIKVPKAGLKKCGQRISFAAFSVFLFSVCLLFWRPRSGFTAHFLSVGQGDCAVIRHEKAVYMVDGGSTSNLKVGEEIILPCLKYYGISEVEGVFISHADADHMNGILQWLDNYTHSHVKINHIILPDLTEEKLQEEFGDVIALAMQNGIRILTLGAGDTLKLGGLKIWALHPKKNYADTEDANGYSQVLLFDFKKQGILMTGDIGAEQERAILAEIKQEKESSIFDPINIVAFKAPHHGSKYSNSVELLEFLQPDNTILSYGMGNSYGHPHGEVLERLEQIETNVYKTARSGMVTVRMMDGEVMVEEYVK